MGKLCSKLGLKPWTVCLQLVVFLFYVLVQRRVVGGKEGNQPSLIQEAPPLSWCNAECRFEKLNLRPSLGVAPGNGWRSSTSSLGVTPSDGCRSSTSARFLVQRRIVAREAQPPPVSWCNAEYRLEKLNLRPCIGFTPSNGWRSSTSTRFLVQRRIAAREAQAPPISWCNAE